MKKIENFNYEYNEADVKIEIVNDKPFSLDLFLKHFPEFSATYEEGYYAQLYIRDGHIAIFTKVMGDVKEFISAYDLLESEETKLENVKNDISKKIRYNYITNPLRHKQVLIENRTFVPDKEFTYNNEQYFFINADNVYCGNNPCEVDSNFSFFKFPNNTENKNIDTLEYKTNHLILKIYNENGEDKTTENAIKDFKYDEVSKVLYYENYVDNASINISLEDSNLPITNGYMEVII